MVAPFISKLEAGSIAAECGLQIGQRIQRVNGEYVSDAKDASFKLRAAEGMVALHVLPPEIVQEAVDMRI